MPEKTITEEASEHHDEPVCDHCGSSDAVHHNLCRRCRGELRGEDHQGPPQPSMAPHQPTPRPPRNPPWRRRGA